MSLLDQPTITPREGRTVSFGTSLRPPAVNPTRRKAMLESAKKWRILHAEQNRRIQQRARIIAKLKRAQLRLYRAQILVAQCKTELGQIESQREVDYVGKS